MKNEDLNPQQEILKTDLGSVELIRAGSGPKVFFVHGTPGGSDSSLSMGRFLIEGGFELIAPSRPGYLGTPLDGLKTIDQQADLHAATIKALGEEKVSVISWSGGGPSAYRLAIRYPELVKALVPFASVSQRLNEPNEGFEEKLMMKTNFGNWILRFLARHESKSMVNATLKAEGDLTDEELTDLVNKTMSDEAMVDVVITMAKVIGDYSNRKQGIKNDWEQFGSIDSLDLQLIKVPTMVIWGDSDADVPPSHSEYAAKVIPKAQKMILENGTHLALFVHPEARKVQKRVCEWLR